jgi:uncharacterized protein (DUF1501 family)
MKISRRAMLTAGAAAVGGGAVMASLAPSLRVAFTGDKKPARDILVVVFLRFGSDGLTMIAPSEDADYRDSRPTIAVVPSGPGAGLPVGALGGVPFFMHPAIPELKTLYDAGSLAVVHAVGLPTNTRSHFESQEMMDRGVTERDAGQKGPLAGGWLSRHLLANNSGLTDLGVVAAAADVQTSLLGFRRAVAIPDVTQFNVIGGDFNLNTIEALNTGSDPYAAGVRGTVNMVRAVRARLAQINDGYTTSTAYPGGEFSIAMRSVANLIKMNAGLEIATVDFGGWDHHYKMNQYFPSHATQLSKTLSAFWDDMAGQRDRITVVTMTEFGRRLEENTAGGTDHGAGSFMFVLGGGVKGGRMYGTWPGLRPADLREGDLRITTDMRQVLAEILIARRNETALSQVFPTLAYQPLGMLNAIQNSALIRS